VTDEEPKVIATVGGPVDEASVALEGYAESSLLPRCLLPA
jgi:hypothetical protein